MNQRFRQEEIERISKQYADDELYKAICYIGHQLESEMKDFGLCSEECLCETYELLSAIADKGRDFQGDADEWWLRKYNEYRRFDRHVNEDDILKAIGIVVGFAVLALDSSTHKFYRYTLSEQLMLIVASHKFDGWQSTLDSIFSIPLPDGWFDTFIDEEPEENELPIPKAINTERAQTYFQKAIDKGYMKMDGGKFVWLGVGSRGEKTQLAYFLGRIYGYKHSANGNKGTEFPEQELNELFGESRLYTLLTQSHSATKTQRWKNLIDDMFE